MKPVVDNKIPGAASADDDNDDDSDAADVEKDVLSEDPLTEVIGQVGPWQYTLWVVLALSIMIHCWQMMANKFLTYKVDHWCARPDHLRLAGDVGAEQWLNWSAPIVPGTDRRDRCNVYRLAMDADMDVDLDAESAEVVPCTQWEYDTSIFQNSVVQRFDLVCGREYLSRVAQVFFFVGNFTGVLLSGIVADKFGRKVSYMTFLSLWIVFGALGSVTTNVYQWIFIRFMCGAISLAYNNVAAVYIVETTHGKWRTLSGQLFYGMGWYSGYLTLAGLTYVCRNMKTLEVVIAFSAIPWLSLWYLMPESPRWLLAKGRKEVAKNVIKQACKWNGKPIKDVDHFVDTYESQKAESGSFKDLLKYPGIRRNLLIMCLVWFTFSMGFYGLTYNTPTFDFNLFLVFALPAMVVIPLTLMLPFIENTAGRKLPLTVALLVAGVALWITAVLPKGSLGIIICAWIGTLGCSVSMIMGYDYTKELFPTVLRTTALGTASASARIGSILSPIVAVMGDVSDILPLLTYGFFGILAGVLSIWIWPETRDVRLADSVEECERLSQAPNPWLRCFRPETKTKAEALKAEELRTQEP